MLEWLGTVAAELGLPGQANGAGLPRLLVAGVPAVAAIVAGGVLLYLGRSRCEPQLRSTSLLLGAFLTTLSVCFAVDAMGAYGAGEVVARLSAAIIGLAALIRLIMVAPAIRQLPSREDFHRAHEALSQEALNRQLAQRALRSSEGRFRVAFDQAAVGMLITEPGGRILRYNAAFLALTGHTPDILRRVSPLALMHPEDRRRLQDTVASLGSDRQQAQLEARLAHADGKPVWASFSVSCLNSETESGLVWQIQDISERKNYEQALQKARDNLEREVTERTRELQAANEQLRRLARDDELTGLSNRRHLTEELKRACASARRYGHPVSALMVDVDHFKHVNDHYGHQVGDRVLTAVALILRESCRKTDIVGRYGGDELCVVLPHSDAEAAVSTAEKIRLEVEGLTVAAGSQGVVRVSCSIGVAELGAGEWDSEAMLSRADKALYAAKHAGRNRISHVASESVEEETKPPTENVTITAAPHLIRDRLL